MRLQALPAFSDNYIWLLESDHGRDAIIVDPGEAEPVLAALEGRPRPHAILLTHHHDDHIGGVTALLQHWPDLPVFGPDDPRIPYVNGPVGQGDPVQTGPWRFETIATPGHTSSHVAFHGHGLLFSGDTLFSLGCGRLFEGTPGQMLDSLERLAALPPETLVCCGHEYTLSNAIFARAVEPENEALEQMIASIQTLRDASRPSLPSRLGDELACNPFLRIDQPAVTGALRQRAPAHADDRVSRFAELRRWKDGFKA